AGLSARFATALQPGAAILVGRQRPRADGGYRSLDRANAGSVRRTALHSGGTVMKQRPTSQPEAMAERTGQSEPASALITPSDVLRQACAWCGAILPAPLLRLDAIPGQEHLRRAVSV